MSIDDCIDDFEEYVGKYDPDTFLGLLVSPKTREVVLAVDDGGSVELYLPGFGPCQGTGYRDDYDPVADCTECARTHTPGGVRTKGAGLGLLLYSALALGASNNCVQSNSYQRSLDATYWWRRAAEVGFAQENHECSREEREEYLLFDFRELPPGMRSRIIEEGEFWEDGDIEGELEGSFTFTPEDMIEDVYVLTTQAVLQSGFVLLPGRAVLEFVDLEAWSVPPLGVYAEVKVTGAWTEEFLQIYRRLCRTVGLPSGVIRSIGLKDNNPIGSEPPSPGWRRTFGALMDLG